MNATLRSQYRTVVVGAGVMGLFTALHLARAGGGPILVIDRGFLSNGASGRNGGGVRQQWETPATIRLAREAVQLYRNFGHEFGYNIWFRQGGYLFLARTQAEMDSLTRVHAVVRGEGLRSELLRPAQVAQRVEGLNAEGLVGASYLSSDGTLYPFPAIWALFEAIRSLGVEVALGREVTGVAHKDGHVVGVGTRTGTIPAETLVNAAGGWSGDLSRMAGLEVPNVATRHEILATEALKPFLDPMVARLGDGLYVSQTMRGELVGGLTMAHRPGTRAGMPSSPEFLRRMSTAILQLFPSLASVRILRAWSGFYDDLPDGFPVIGEDPRLPGFVHANGFGGHGFMLAPAASRRVAQAVLGETTDLDPKLFHPARFLDPHRPMISERLQLG
jgi:sarcosine oxidase, subunit beta